MRTELEDFVHHCRVERRLSPLTCSAYERDVGACLAFLEAEGFTDWGDLGPAHVRRFLVAEAEHRPAESSQARTPIQELLGHKHLDSTQRYTRVTAHELRGAAKRLPWARAAHDPPLAG